MGGNMLEGASTAMEMWAVAANSFFDRDIVCLYVRVRSRRIIFSSLGTEIRHYNDKPPRTTLCESSPAQTASSKLLNGVDNCLHLKWPLKIIAAQHLRWIKIAAIVRLFREDATFNSAQPCLTHAQKIQSSGYEESLQNKSFVC